MPITIFNGSNRPVNVATGTIPQMAGALENWYQPLVFEPVSKAIEGFQVVETGTPVNFRGVVMPLTGRDLLMVPEGERAWNWIRIFSDNPLPLKPDDVIKFIGVQYRVMGSKNYSLYQYLEYVLVEDYVGSGPST